MTLTTRRAVLLAGTAMAGLAIVPIARGGIESFLRRVLADHFGEDVLEIEGIGDFIRAYAANAGNEGFTKRAAAEVYFAWRGDLVREIGQAAEMRNRFLQTILTRSNIIAIYQGAEGSLDFADADPWNPTCGLYLSAFADQTLTG